MRALALVSLLVTAYGTASCGPAASRPDASPSAARVTSPTAATAFQGPFAAFFGSPATGQVLTIVGADGKVYGQVSPHGRTGDFGFQPSVSTSDTAVYYLDGDSALMRLRPGGSPEHVRDLPGSSSVHAVFAVSPDNQHIAISLLTYGPTPSGPGMATANYTGMKLYVEDFDGSHHIDLFDSPTVAEWPVGWHRGALIIADSLKQIPGLGVDPHPYFAFGGIHVVDATTGVREASLCSGVGELGLATAAGVLCNVANVESDWSEKETSTGLNCSGAALQPGGASIACSAYPENPVLWTSGSSRTLPAPPVGWVGHDHLLLSSSQTAAQLFDVGSGTLQPVDVVAAWTVGAIPGGL